MSKNRFIKSEEDRRHENIERLRLILKKINFIQSICKSFTNTALALSDEEMGRPILHPINKSLKLREYWFNKEVPNYANKKTMGQQDKSENRHGRASGTQCR